MKQLKWWSNWNDEVTACVDSHYFHHIVPDLHKAFRIVKNNIGFGWKDLARALPYAPAKEMAELNNEIKAIEYENQGQLKEQVRLV